MVEEELRKRLGDFILALPGLDNLDGFTQSLVVLPVWKSE